VYKKLKNTKKSYILCKSVEELKNICYYGKEMKGGINYG